MIFSELEEALKVYKESKFTPYSGALAKASKTSSSQTVSCMAFTMHNTVSSPWIGPKEVADEWGSGSGVGGLPPYTQEQFEKYIEFVAGFHPLIRKSLNKHIPTLDDAFVMLNCDHGYINYAFSCLYRKLWHNPEFVYIAIYLKEQGFTTHSALILLHAGTTLWQKVNSACVVSGTGTYPGDLIHRIATLDGAKFNGEYSLFGQTLGGSDGRGGDNISDKIPILNLETYSNTQFLDDALAQYSR